jgi:hypothetical protein
MAQKEIYQFAAFVDFCVLLLSVCAFSALREDTRLPPVVRRSLVGYGMLYLVTRRVVCVRSDALSTPNDKDSVE